MKRFSIVRYPLENKTIFLRVDYNVPIKNNNILDNKRIIKSLPTIKYLLQKNCKIILATHIGRPDGKIDQNLSTKIIAKELHKIFSKEKIITFNDSIGKEIKQTIEESKPKTIFLLENLRYYKEEKQNDIAFAHSLANLAQVYINDAFANSHRKHASVHAITKFIPSMAGILLEAEILQLSKALIPKRPSIWILGGAKLDKTDLVKNALLKADYILLGGALIFPFLKAKGISVGMSKIDHNSVKVAKKILKKKNSKKLVFPLDFNVTETFSQNAKSSIVPFNQIKNNQIALDLGPKTIPFFKNILKKAHTIVWNGPLGYYEWAKFATSTKEIGHFIGKLTATSICGGGETSEALKKFHLEHNMTHISTGGGAALKYLEGNPLPAITALEKNYLKFKKIKIPPRNESKI